MTGIEQLTGWDLTVLVVALISMGLGMFQGMVRTVADLASWVIAFFGAFWLAPYITEFIGLKAYPWVGLLIGFVLLFFLVRWIGVLLSKGLKTMGLSGADRALGAIVGLARAVLIIAALASAAKLLEMDKQPAWEKAFSRPLLEQVTQLVAQYAPKLDQFKPAALRRS